MSQAIKSSSFTTNDIIFVGSAIIALTSSLALAVLGITNAGTLDTSFKPLVGITSGAAAFALGSQLAKLLKKSILDISTEGRTKVVTSGEYPVSICPSLKDNAYDVMLTGAENRKEIDAEVDSVTQEELTKFLEIMKCENFAELPGLFKVERLFYIALRALKDGHINAHQMGTLAIFDSTFALHRGAIFEGRVKESSTPPKSYTLFNNGNVNPEAFGLLMKSQETNDDVFKLNEAEWTHFLELVKKLPPSEQQFLVAPNIMPKINDRMWVRLNDLKINPFILIKNGDGSYQHIIPSCGMMQAYLTARFKENAVLIKPVIGPWSDQGISDDWLENAHVVGIYHHKVKSEGSDLDEADGFEALVYSFYHHDFYHCAMASFIPKEDRLLFREFYELIKADKARIPGKPIYGFTFADMDHYRYKRVDPKTAFWEMIAFHSAEIEDTSLTKMFNHLVDQGHRARFTKLQEMARTEKNENRQVRYQRLLSLVPAAVSQAPSY